MPAILAQFATLARTIFLCHYPGMTPNDLLRKFKRGTMPETVKNAAKSTGFSTRTVYNWIATGSIPAQSQRWIEFDTGGALKASKR